MRIWLAWSKLYYSLCFWKGKDCTIGKLKVIISVMRYFKWAGFNPLKEMAGHTSRGKLRKTGYPSKTSIIPKAQMYITDKVVEEKPKGTEQQPCIYLQPIQKTRVLEKSRQSMIKEVQKVETKQPHKKLSCIFFTRHIRKYQD